MNYAFISPAKYGYRCTSDFVIVISNEHLRFEQEIWKCGEVGHNVDINWLIYEAHNEIN